MIVSQRKRLFDPVQVKQAVELVVEPGSVFEFRAVDATLDGDRRPSIVYGYFDSADALLKELSRIRSAMGFYITINPVDPKLHARAYNRLKRGGETETTADKDILRRRWLMVDCDVDRPTDISSSDAEHESALNRAAKIRAELSAEGWPEPIYGSSGNGGRLLYRIDLPAADDGLVNRVLKGLQKRFGGDGITIDDKVFNPARIDKLCGTLVCKGDDMPERPHRMAAIIDKPEVLRVVSVELLETMAAHAPATTPSSSNGSTGEKLSAPSFGTTKPGAMDRARAYLDKLPAGISGEKGSAATFNAARHLIIKFGLSRADTLTLMKEYNSRCQPEWSDNDLERKVDDAAKLPGERGTHVADSDPTANKPSSGNTTIAKPEEKQGSVTVTAYCDFPVDLLPEALRRFVRTISKATASDAAYAALPALTACASAIGNSRRLRARRGWEAPAILWTACVGDSGTGKSPPMKAAIKPVKTREAKLYREHASAMVEYEQERERYEKQLQEWKRSKGDSEPPEKPLIPIAARCLLGDTTLEAAAPVLRDNYRGVLKYHDELAGLFGGLDRYSGKGKSSADAAQYLSIFDGDSIFIDRKTGSQRIYIPSAAISICGGIQPGILKRVLTQEHKENGFAARFLYAAPPRRLRKWTDAEVSPDVEREFSNMLNGLYDLQPDEDENGDPIPVVVEMTRDAKRRYVRHYNAHNETGLDFTEAVAAAWSKLEQYPLRLALVVHQVRLAAGDPRADADTVDEESIDIGIELTKWFANEAQRIYGLLDEAVVDQDVRELVELISRRGGRVTVRDLQHARRQYRGPEGAKVVERDLNSLKAAKLGDWLVVEPGSEGGRPAVEFVLHEAVTVTKPHETREIRSSVTVTTHDKPASVPEVLDVNHLLAEAAVKDSCDGDDAEEVLEWTY